MANFEFKSNGNQPGVENSKKPKNNDFIQCEEGPGVVAYLLTLGRLSNLTIVLCWKVSTGHYITRLYAILLYIKEPKQREN